MVGKKLTLSKIGIGFILVTIVLTMVIPLLNILAKSLSSPDKIHLIKGYDIIPKGFSLIHYKVILSNDIVITALMNSLIITVSGTALALFFTTITAYVLTRKHLIGKGPIMICLIVFMILEPGIVPEYMTMKDLNLLDSLWSMILFKMINVYYLIIMMRFIEEIPESLIEAARIDGAGHMKLFIRIVLPLARVPLLTIGMFYAVAKWNEFFKSSIFLSTRENTVLQVLLRQFVVERESTTLISHTTLLSNSSVAQLDFSALKATTIIVAMIPILLLYPIILRYYTNGVMEGGVKE